MKNIWKSLVAMSLVVVTSCTLFLNTMTAQAEEVNAGISGEIEVIFNQNEEEMQPYVEAFEKKYPGVKVHYTSYNDFETSIKLRMEEGDYGDVLYFPSFILTEDADEYFEPLGDFGKLSNKYNFLEQGRHYNDIVYGIPSSAYFIGIVYNKEVFDKAGITTIPTTIEEFLDDMELIDKNTDALPFYMGYKDSWILTNWGTFPFVEMTGDPYYKFDEFITDVNPFREGTVFNRTMRLMYDLVEKGYTEVTGESLPWWESVIGLHEGRVGCAVMGTWALHDYKKVGEHGENIGFFPFPNVVDGQQYLSLNCNYSYAIARNSDNKEAAKAFLNFLLDESGYAFHHDEISVLKTEQYPECYGELEDVAIYTPICPSSEAYLQYEALAKNWNMYNEEEYKQIVEAAAGISGQSFEDVMNDWNERWEASREPWMLTTVVTEEGKQETLVNLEEVEVEFSQNELAYMEANPVIRVGYNRNLAPLSYEADGEFTGVAYDICTLIGEKSGLEMEYYGYDNTAALVAALSSGEIDIVAGVEQVSDSDIKYSKEYVEYMDVLVRHNTKDVSSLQKQACAVGEKYATSEDARENTEYNTINKCIQSIENLSADYTITNYYSANYYIRENHCDNLTVMPYEKHNTFQLGFGNDADAGLVAICNKCIYSIPDGEVEIMLMEYMDSVVHDVTLRTFIKAHPFMCMSVVVVVFSLLFIGIFTIFYERDKASRIQALEAKKYELLATLADEYFFEYDYAKDKFKFDLKFENVAGNGAVNNNDGSSDSAVMKQFVEQVSGALKQKQDTQFNIVLDRDNGTKQWYRVITSVVLDDKQQPVHLIGKIVNIQKEMEEMATYQDKAHRDALTKLYNREGLSAHMPEETDGIMIAVMDMDDFKMVNDTLGHDGGDYALMYFADKLEEHMGKDALLARFGGDEFVAVLANTSEQDAREKLTALVEAMDITLRYAGNSCKLSISAGAAYFGRTCSFDEMFHQADQILYVAKKAGKNSYKLEGIS